MTILAKIYASAPTDSWLMPTCEILVPTLPPVRLVADNEDRHFGVEGVMQLFRAGPVSFALPDKDETGMQRLAFGFSGIGEDLELYVQTALSEAQPSYIVYRVYSVHEPLEPVRSPIRMPILAGQMRDGQAVFEGGYADLLNFAWPRQRYTLQNAPGLKFL